MDINDLSSDQKYAISKIIDGTVGLVGDLTYSVSIAESIAAAVVVFVEENGSTSVDEVIEELGRYKGDNNG